MSWKEKLLPASFRGIGFNVADIDYKSGRRIVSYEFPKLNTPSSEDMGRKQRIYTVQAYLIGEDFLDDLKDLIDACESEGAGDLIHPFMGELRVQCDEISVKQSMTTDGGFALISMAFVEAGEELYPNPTADQLASMQKSKLSAIKAAKDNFKERFSIVGKGQLLINSASSQVGAWQGKLTSAMKTVKGESGAIADLSYSIRNLKANSTDLFSDPAKFADNFVGNISGLGESLNSTGYFGGAFGAYKKLYKTDNSSTYNTNPLTETRRQELTNQKAVDDLAASVATVEAAEQAVYVEFESYDDAIEAREELLEQFDKIIQETKSDEFYMHATAIRALIIEMIPSKDKSLPELMKIQTRENENSLSFSYRVYGNITNENKITKRNKIVNPLFFPSETILEVPIE